MQKISYFCPLPIWKIDVVDQHHIVVELRDNQLFKTIWKVFNLNEEHCVFSYENAKNSWWKSIVGATKDYLVLHELKQGKNPEISATALVHIPTAVVQNFPLFQFDGLKQNKIILSNPKGEKNEVILPESHFTFIIEEATVYIESNEHFIGFIDIIKHHTGDIPCLECEYLEAKNYIIIAYYSKVEEQNYTSKLLIINKLNEKVLLEMCYEKLTGAIYGMFFVLNNKLIYSNGKNVVTILQLLNK